MGELQKKDFNQNYVLNLSTSAPQLETEFFLNLLFWMRTAACDDIDSLLLQAAVYAFLFEIRRNPFKHFPVFSRHMQYQNKDYSICPSQHYMKFLQCFMIV